MLQKLATEIYQKAAGQCTFQESAIAEESAAEAKRVECDVREIFSICSKIPTIGAKIYCTGYDFVALDAACAQPGVL